MAVSRDKKSRKYIAQVGSGKNGTRKKKRFNRKSDAEAWVWEQKRLVARAKESPNYLPEMPIDDLLERYLESLMEVRDKHRRDIRNSVINLVEFCGFESIGDVTALPLERYKDSKVKSLSVAFCNEKFISNRTKNKKIKHLKSLLEFARRNGFLLQNPLLDLELAKVKPTEKRALTEEECVELLKSAKEYSPMTWYPVIFTMINTGMRKGELATLEWEDLDFTRKQIYLKDKPHIEINGEPFRCKWGSCRTLPMRENLRVLLESRPKTSDLVFPSERGGLLFNNWNHRFKRAVRDAKIRNKHEIGAHTLRHTFISQLLSLGKVDLKTVSVLAGHKDLQTTQGYVHLLGGSEEQLRAIESLPDY